MCDCSTISWWLTGWRALHMLACLLAVGLLAFHLLIAPMLRNALSPATCWTILLSLLAAMASGIGWFAAVAGEIGDQSPWQAIRTGTATIVLTHTHFGNLWLIRSMIWLVAVAALALMCRQAAAPRPMAWLLMLAAAALLGSLAWAGHGIDGEGQAARIHVIADALHLVIGAVWPFGLAPFAVTLFHLQRDARPDCWRIAAELTRRFSAAALICVALLTSSGLVNSYLMLPTFGSLWQSGYGRLLSLKISLFIPMILLAAYNRFALKPRLGIAIDSPTVMARLRRSVIIEFTIGMGIVLVVALLGLLAPPMR